MEKVIILVDFSKEAKNTVDYGIQFALEYDKEIEFLNTTLTSSYHYRYISESKEMEFRYFERVKESFNVLLNDLTNRYQHLPDIDIEIQYGIQSEHVKRVFEEKNAQLIITPGKYVGNTLQLLTEQTRMLVDNCTCPVMVIPPEATFQSYQSMVYATDYNEDDIFLTRYLYSTSSKAQSVVYGLHTTNSRKSIQQNHEVGFRNLIGQNLQYDHFQIDTSGETDIAGSIAEYADVQGADIMAVVNSNAEIMDSFVKPGSQNGKFHTRLPLVIFQGT